MLTGFATIGAVIALGALLAHIGLLDVPAQRMLSRLAFYVASPALMVTVVGDSDVDGVLSAGLVVAAISVVVCVALYLVGARWVWRHQLAEIVIGSLSASYVNAGNLGLPIAAYVLGDAALVAPVLLLQLVVLQPLALAILDAAVSERRFSWRRALVRPVTNPLTIASVLGLVLALGGWRLPAAIYDPLALVGGMAVPSMLLAYGVSLRLGPKPGEGSSVGEIATISVLKLVVQPGVAYLAARFVFGLSDTALLAATVLAALPTAQNIFVHAVRYGRGEVVARDSIFVTTVLSVPAILGVVALLT